ncbi:MAG: metallophosphoesterase family protein [Butyribacter sp.]|nr:metallophosphoesterase family protein [bacterium]MDY3855081.1 metallophosphoesterase family protein [Butyribacter sp.]
MGTCWISGDTHSDVRRLSADSFYEQKEFTVQEDNYVIICGDFGLVWDRNGESGREKHWLDWLENKKFTTLFVPGNHENYDRLDDYPEEEWHGGKVHKIRPHVIELLRGEVYEILGKKFFAFGGASSHDIQDGILDYEDAKWKEKAKKLKAQKKYMYRVKGLSWWEQELPSGEEMDNGIRNLEANDWTVDFIITHSPSTIEQTLLDETKICESDILTDYLDRIKTRTEYRWHFFGHMHLDKAINDKDICLYEQIIRII